MKAARAFCLCLLAAACAGPKRRAYSPRDAVVYHLDLAQNLADAGRRAEADWHFDLAQRRMEELWTLSVTKKAGALAVNENIDDYRGEDFERALSHVLRALNLLALDRREEALVEARRVEVFLDEAARAAPRARTYRDDAFARWLAAALYEDLGKPDDARVSAQASRRAYEAYGKTYGTPPPPEPTGEGPAELILVHLEGLIPRKVRRSGDGPLELLLQTSYPAYEPPAPAPASCELAVGTATVPSPVVEDVAAIAAKDLEEKLLALKARSAVRAAVKLAGSAWGVDARGSEFADIRGWSALPARLRVARLRLPAGPGQAEARCRGADGNILWSRALDFRAEPGRRSWLIAR